MGIPSFFLRTTSVYRSWGAPGQRLGCGFWLAPRGYCEVANCGDYWALGLVLRGGGHFSGERLTAGCVYVRHPGVAHDFSTTADYAECWLDLGGPLAGIPALMGLTVPSRLVFRAGLDLVLIRRWDALLSRAQTAPDLLLPVLAGEVLALAAALVDASHHTGGDEHGALLSEACRLLDGGAQRPVLERLALRHGISFERLRKLFRERLGVAPGAYRIRQRMDRARALLRDGTLTVQDIAQAVGYASTATFSLQFKAHCGQSPDHWRRLKPTTIRQ